MLASDLVGLTVLEVVELFAPGMSRIARRALFELVEKNGEA